MARITVAIALACWAGVATAPASAALRFAGTNIVPGGLVRARAPLSPQEKQYATEGGNHPPSHAIAVLAVPQNFDPRKSWPVLIVLSTNDNHRTNGGDLSDFYLKTGLSEGWVLLAGDGTAAPRHDSASWRSAMTLAALDALYRSFPGSPKWPVACAGFSGGAKTAGIVAPLLARAGCHLSGIYLTGINEDRLSEGYRQLQPGRAFLDTPIFISSGQGDTIARPEEQMEVKLSLRKTGFTRIRFATFSEGHVFRLSYLADALRWFRQLENSP